MNLNPKNKLITESLTVKLNSLANKLSSEGKNIINLTVGELDFPTPLYIQKEIKKKVNLNKYTPTIGLTSLRQAIANLVCKDYKIKITYQNVAVTSGSKQGLFESMFTILKKGDEVIILSPDWVTYRHQIILNDAIPVIVPLNKKFDLDIEKIKKAISKRTKAIILNSPNNPTGSIYSKSSLLKLKKILKNKSIYIIVDDIYSKIFYDKNYKTPALFAPQKKYLILINSFSKSQALMGWRIGYVVAEKEIIDAIASYQSHTTGNASLLSQIAAEKIIENGDKTDNFVKILKKQRDLANTLLQTIPKISYEIPKGAFYYFINVSKIEIDTEKFCKRLLEKGLALVPGEAFGYKGFVRLSFSVSKSKLMSGIKILKEFCKEY
ncbi:MAG: aminotransferase class I/II-fold pyridoxal phosphate-dependent enzyme [Candidatus Paceibacterota bacterium]